MKKIIKKKILISAAAVVIIMILSAFVVEKNNIFADVKKDDGYVKANGTGDNKFAGTWYLSRDNDFDTMNEIFPDVYAFGDELVIRPDGKIYWHIGAAGAAGTYEVYGDQLTACVSEIMEPDEYRIAFALDKDGSLCMRYNSADLKWEYGLAAY